MAREAVYIRIFSEEMGHKQSPTPLQKDNAMEDAVCNKKYNQNKQKQCTCNSIGSDTENARNNSEYIGDQAKQIMQTTGQNTMQPPTTKTK